MSATKPGGNVRRVNLVPLISLDIESQMKVKEIRNEQAVRKWMHTDHVIGANEHLEWISQLKQDDRRLVFVVMEEAHTPLGVVSVSVIDRINKRADWAFYLTDTARGGLGSALEFAFIDFVFGAVGMEKLNCEVIEGNDAVVKLHKKFLFQDEGFRRSNIIKSGVRLGVHLLGLTRQEWLDGKADVQNSYKAIFEKFFISIQWLPGETTAPTPIDQIEAARAKNNLNWMSILRLSLEKSPHAATQIVAEIKRLDREISALTDKLTGADDAL